MLKSMKIRKNASLKSVAEAARNRARRLSNVWRKMDEAARNNWSDRELRAREEAMWSRFDDVRTLADHLCRLAGIDTLDQQRAKEIEAKKAQSA